jgi:3',5'-cyclic AMP phosphodiesterase CpdA
MRKRSWILQIADLHLIERPRNGLPAEQCISLMAEAVKNTTHRGTQLFVAVCGDLTSKAASRGYDLSKQFIHSLRGALGEQAKFVFCPGNHDINTKAAPEDAFSGFNSAVWHSGQTAMFSRERTAITVPQDGVQFVLVNSAYHLDHKFGKIELELLGDVLATNERMCRILLVHHHSIPAMGDKNSAIRNAQQFLQVCVANRVDAILHGHGHMESMLSLGRRQALIIGVGSLFYPPKPNYNNEFNLICLRGNEIERILRFRFLADRPNSRGKLGSFVPTDIRIL